MDQPDSGSCADGINCATSTKPYWGTPRKNWDTRRRQRHRQARIHESQERCFNKAYQWLQNILTYMHARPNDDCVLHRINTTETAEPNSHVLLAVLNYSTCTHVNRNYYRTKCYTLIHKKCQTPVPIPQWTLNWLDMAWIYFLDRETQSQKNVSSKHMRDPTMIACWTTFSWQNRPIQTSTFS